ncbi:MAG: response regulator [Desulfobacterales bacterium]|nr:response regulator [Desulfobacterales bacterium]
MNFEPSLLDLFKSEVETYTAILKEGLISLRNNPAFVNKSETLIKAAHSIKGGAQILEIEEAIQLSQTIEESLIAFQRGKLSLTPENIDKVSKDVDMLKVFSDLSFEKSGESISKHKVDIIPASPKIEDKSMIDLFRTEIETHLEVLTYGLLSLESNPNDTSQIESMMRAAHSIKGGSKVMNLEISVQLAHIMEDCFVAAQKKDISLGPENIDILLKSVDIIKSISEFLDKGLEQWLIENKEQIQTLLDSISLILEGKTVSKVNVSNVPYQQKSEDKDRMVRVTATKIEKLMGLTGEIVVNDSWFSPFLGSLIMLKKSQNELLNILEKLGEVTKKEVDLKQIHELLINAKEKNKESILSLNSRLNDLDMFINSSFFLSDGIYHEVIGIRMRPFSDGIKNFPRMVRDLSRTLNKKIQLEIIGKSTEVDRDILEKLDAPLTHILRNAIDHGIEPMEERYSKGKPETGKIFLEAVHRAGMLIIRVTDDGRGINFDNLREKVIQKNLASPDIVEKLTDAELLEFLFLPGFSTASKVTEISGRGVGLDVVYNMVKEVGGFISITSIFGQGTSFHLKLPLTLSVIKTFLVEINKEIYGFPLSRIEKVFVISKNEFKIIENRQYFNLDNSNIPLIYMDDILEFEQYEHDQDENPVVIVSDGSNFYGLIVDRFIGECELVIRPLDPILGKIPDINAAAIMLDGSPVLIFDVEDLIHSIENILKGKKLSKINTSKEKIKKILVVEDSATIREMEKKLLEKKGYEVDVAFDGMDGWNAVRTENFDLVISDIDMPRMDGIKFITHIKNDDNLKSLPVIIVSYKDTEDYRQQGLEAGANCYLTKNSLQDETFINSVVNLIGEPL